MPRCRSALVLAALLFTSCSKQPAAPPEPQKLDCKYHEDCPNAGVCYLGKCEGTATCFERPQCAGVPVCADQRCICDRVTQRCLPVCVTDNDCAADAQCLDGVCTPYGGAIGGMVPAGGAKQQLQVGIGQVDLDFPMGVSMAGYGTRRGPQTPYRDALGGSNAWFDRPDVRAVLFDDGEEMFVLMRVPLSWSTDFLITETARKVQLRTGLNLIDRIVTSAAHSHSHPARFWHLVVGLNFGIFGYDEFSYEIFDRLTTSFSDAIVMALESKQPAKFGWKIIERFDPMNRIHRDRRNHNDRLPGYIGKDDRMMLARVDDLNDRPLVIFTHFGMHGTVFGGDNPILTGDAPGGVEVELTRFASAKFGAPVMGVYLQGNAGDISPARDDRDSLEDIQLLGLRTWQVIEPELESITTSADVDVGVISGRIQITHQALGYAENEFFDPDTQCEASPPYFRYGAFQCVEDQQRDDDDPSTKFADGDLNCIFAVECLTSGFPIPQFQKTRLSVVKLGDLVMPTMPGEPHSQFGRDISDRVLQAVPGARGAVVLGYSQDHHFYLMNADDWLQGGYEPSRDIWGWRLGPYLADQSAVLAGELVKAPNQRVFDNGNLKPMWWPLTADDQKRVEINETAGDPAQVIIDVPERVERLEVVTFSWSGGHPGVDRPRIVLERENNGAFEPVMRSGGLTYDDAMFEMLVHYDGRCTRRNCEEHKWRVEWEEARNFPVGRYRLRAAGKALKNGSVVDYSAASRAFDLVPSSKLEVYGLQITATGIEARVVDPPAVRFVPDGEGRRAETIGHRLRSALVPRHIGAPVESTAITVEGYIRAPSGGRLVVDGNAPLSLMSSEPRTIISGYAADGTPLTRSAGDRPTTKIDLPVPAFAPKPGSYYIDLRVTDVEGNYGTVTATITRS